MSRLEMFSGDTKTINVTVLDDAGAKKDLTSATITWKLFLRSDKVTAKISKTVGSGVTITDATNGVFQVALAAADTAELAAGDYIQECEVVDSALSKSTVFQEPVKLREDLIV